MAGVYEALKLTTGSKYYNIRVVVTAYIIRNIISYQKEICL